MGAGVANDGAANGAGDADGPFQAGQAFGNALAGQRREVRARFGRADDVDAVVPEADVAGAIEDDQPADSFVGNQNI